MKQDSTEEIVNYDVMEKIKELLYMHFDRIVQDRKSSNDFWTLFKENNAYVIDTLDPEDDKYMHIFSLNKKL